MSKKRDLWLSGMDANHLFIPEEVSDLLEVQIPIDSTETEFEDMILVNNSGQSLLNNELDLDTYMDILDSVGIDPQFHLQEAAWVAANIFDC